VQPQQARLPIAQPLIRRQPRTLTPGAAQSPRDHWTDGLRLEASSLKHLFGSGPHLQLALEAVVAHLVCESLDWLIDHATDEALDTRVGNEHAAVLDEFSARIVASMAAPYWLHWLHRLLVPRQLVVPWNVPQFLIMPKLIPALIAGCTVVVKPAPETPLDALWLAEMLDEIALPEGVVSIIPGGRETGEALVRHPGVDKISFTGSSATGRHIASLCGEQLKRVSLELGGKSAAIILDDADIGHTVKQLKMASLMNNGQACVAQTRILVSERRHDEVVDALADMMSGLQVGDPADDATDVGPLVAKRQQNRVRGYIEAGVDAGARIVLGGTDKPYDRGWYVQPTLFTDATNDMRIAREEIFGPVLTVLKYSDERDAVRIANDSDYGLGGSVWTADVAHGLTIAEQVRTGTFGINMYTLDTTAPFGGFKQSGIGREFGSEGMSEYVELQSTVSAGTLPDLN